MAKQLKLKRGTTSQHGSFTGAEGEVTVDTDKETLVVHDGSTAGGHPVAAEDMANVSSASIAGRLGTSAIAGTKVAPDFGSQNVVTTGNLDIGDLPNTTTNAELKIAIQDTDGVLKSDNAIKINPNQDVLKVNELHLSSNHIRAGANGPLHLTTANANGTVDLKVNTTHVEVNGNLLPATDSTDNVGATGTRWANVYSDAANVAGNITVTGTVDGRDVAADGTKLDGIEASATADQSNAEIRAAVEAASDSNVFTDADHTKLNAIEASADVTDATNVNAAGAVMNSDTSTASMNFVVDEDNMSSNSATKIPSQQSVKAYVDTEVAGVVNSAPSALNTLNELAAALGDDANYATTTATSIGTKLPKGGGEMTGNITFSGSQTVDGRDLSADGSKLDGIESGATADQSNAEIRAAVEAASDSNVFTDADHSKLNGIASSANNYSHPSHPGDDFSIDTGHLSGATVIDDIDINVTTDGSGHVTDCNGSVATRNLTLGDLGYTGATNANNYSHPSYNGDDFSIDTGHLSGATVIDDIDINVTTDGSGHVTDCNGTVATRNLTLGDLGFTGATNANYITNTNQLTNGSGFLTSAPGADVQIFTSSGTWTKPSSGSIVLVKVWGGGGGGGNGSYYCGGGGGGGYASYSIPLSSCSSTESVTVGSGGGDNSDGGTSQFKSSEYRACGGGRGYSGGPWDNNPGGAGGSATGTGAGGNGGTGDGDVPGGHALDGCTGGGGGPGQNNYRSVGGNAVNAGGGGGGRNQDGGVAGGTSYGGGDGGAGASNGSAPGGGGGGRGGSGARGEVRVITI